MTRSRVVVVAILAAASLGGWRLGEARRAVDAPWRVLSVVDGDTIQVQRDGRTDTVRLLGVNTPKPRRTHPAAGGPAGRWLLGSAAALGECQSADSR